MNFSENHGWKQLFIWPGRQWMTYSLVGVLLGVGGKFLIIDSGVFSSLSVGQVAFLVVYTCLVLLISNFVGRSEPRSSAKFLPHNGLARFRRYLTFLPIRNVAQLGDSRESCNKVAEESEGRDPDENDLTQRIAQQKVILIEAILEEYVTPWYTKISSNAEFLDHCRNILTAAFTQFGLKIQLIDRNEMTKEVIHTFHMHWKEYCEATAKAATSGDSIIKCFKFIHPYLQDTYEVTQRFESTVTQFLESLVIPEFQCVLICKFLSGIIVKSFLLYYTEVVSQPTWLNSNLILLLSSGSLFSEIAGSSSQNSSAPATPLPDKSPRLESSDPNSPLNLVREAALQEQLAPDSSPSKSSSKAEKSLEHGYFFINEADSDAPKLKDIKSTILSQQNSRCGPHQGSVSPSTSVSSALSGVIPTMALPLLPCSSCVNESSTPQTMGAGDVSVDTSFSSRLSQSSLSTVSSQPEAEGERLTDGLSNVDFKEGQGSGQEPFAPEICESQVFRAPSPKHYYSFEEISRRKPSHPLLDSGAMSVDGNLTGKVKAEKSSVHQLKLEGLDETPGRSPVYEEPEDFATSIAKLRSLLEERESKGSLISKPDDKEKIESEEFVQGSEGNTCMITSTPPQMDDMSCTDSSVNGNENADFAPEPLAGLKQFFLNITIPKIEPCSETGGQYDFFCIQYEGVYIDEKYDNEPPKVILRNTTVKRRFKEFLSLQTKLEENPNLKKHLKGIKTPNRWLNLSFSKSDALATKKANLEKYLNQICHHPELGTSRDVVQFMAYGDDGFSLDPLDTSDPKHLLSNRLDKLAKKFTGVINSLKDALPSFESNPPSPHLESENSTLDPTALTEPSFDFTSRLSPPDGEENVEASITCNEWFEKLQLPVITENQEVDISNFEENDKETKSRSDEVFEEEYYPTNYPLAAALTQLLCDVLWLPNCRPHNASVATFMSLSGKSLENYVEETIDVFLSDEAVLGYLEWMEKSIKNDVESIQEVQCDTCTELDLKNCLRRRVPAWVRWMWGRNRLDMTIDRITGFLQNSILNYDLILSLSELIFSKLNNPTPEE